MKQLTSLPRLVGLVWLATLTTAGAQQAQYFSVTGPVASRITSFSANGYLTWTNSPTSATFTVQAASSLALPVNWVDYVRVPVTGPVTSTRIYDFSPPSGMVLIPAGSFTMGDTFAEAYNNELPVHTVYVSVFYMDKYLVTKTLWDTVYNWATNRGYLLNYAVTGKAANHPAHTADWYNCVKWCNARSEMEGRTPAYYTSTAQTTVYRGGAVDLGTNFVKWNAGYRLPTEAEWEKAARGGLSGRRFPWGNTVDRGNANYYAIPLSCVGYPYDVAPNCGYDPAFNNGVEPYTSPVGGYFAPNGYGLYDMCGNMFQWCWDWYGPYASGSQSDPRGLGLATYHVYRGGSWATTAYDFRLADRKYTSPSTEGNRLIGFRTVLAPVP